MNPIEIAVDVKLQQHQRMIRRPPGRLGSNPIEAELTQIKLVDKDVDHPNRIVLIDPVFQAFRKQRALRTIRSFNKALHPIPQQPPESLLRESHEAGCFHTARVISGH